MSIRALCRADKFVATMSVVVGRVRFRSDQVAERRARRDLDSAGEGGVFDPYCVSNPTRDVAAHNALVGTVRARDGFDTQYGSKTAALSGGIQSRPRRRSAT